MDSANPKLTKPNSHAYKKLIFEELIPQNQEERSSDVHQRTSISSQDTLGPNSSATSGTKMRRSRRKALNTWFGTLYKVWMFILIFFYGIMTVLQPIYMIKENKIDLNTLIAFLIIVCGLIQSLLAFAGARQESLGKIERAIQIMKVWFGLHVFPAIDFMFGYVISPSRDQGEDSEPLFDLPLFITGLLFMGLSVTFNILPTIKVRNILRSQPEEIYASVQEISNPSSLTPQEPQHKGLNSLFGTCYKVWMLIVTGALGLGGCHALVHIIENSNNLGLKGMIGSLVLVCSMVQCLLASFGAIKQSLRKLEEALFVMKISVGLEAIQFLLCLWDGLKCLPNPTSELEHSVFKTLWERILFMSFTVILNFLPTIKAKNLLRSMLKSNGKDQVALSDPIEKLNSRGYRVYKYWVLIGFFLSFRAIVLFFGEDPYEIPNAFMKLSSNIEDISRFIDCLTGLLICIINSVYLFFVFEGIRRRSLKSILRAIRLMKMKIVLNFISTLSALFLTDLGDKLMEFVEEEKLSEGLFSKYNIYLSIVFAFLLDEVQFYFTYMYGAFKVRDVLKAHKKKEMKFY